MADRDLGVGNVPPREVPFVNRVTTTAHCAKAMHGGSLAASPVSSGRSFSA
jgi:hypothetical protein